MDNGIIQCPGRPASWYLDFYFLCVFSLIPFMSIQTITIYSPFRSPTSQCHCTADSKLEEGRRGHTFPANSKPTHPGIAPSWDGSWLLSRNVVEDCLL